MLMTKLKIVTVVMLTIASAGMGAAQPQETKQAAPADMWARTLLTEKFEQTQKLIKPQPGESRWMEIPWQTSLWEARQLAAKEGKPMFVWSGSGGAPCAPT